MSMLAGLKSRLAKTSPFQVLPRAQWAVQRPTYQDAQPGIIDAALNRSQSRPSGNWYAFASSDAIRKRPLGTSVAGLEIVRVLSTARTPARSCVCSPGSSRDRTASSR